ncbi:hypothetical protein I4U23_002069 [Adineta vaga]|nr:hypothetical protein I4U23_002069 [Adineta vaga]
MNTSSSSVHNLLSNLKSIVELIIKFPGDSLTSQYGAIERIRSAILSILSHGLKQKTGEISEQLWQFIIRLNSNSQKHIHLLQDIYHKENLRLTVEQWIDQSVITQCLSQQISYVENNMDLLEQYYSSHAFMRKLHLYHAFVICIRTVESSDPSLLLTIDPKLSIYGDIQEPPEVLTNDEISNSYALSISKTQSNDSNAAVSKLSVDDSQYKVFPVAQRRILHRRIHSDPIFHVPNNPNNYSHVTSSVLLHEISFNNQENSPNVSYSCEYGSSYDSRTDSFLSIEQSLPLESNKRQSISSKITLIDEEENQFYQSTMFPTDSNVTQKDCLPHSSLFWPRKNQTLDNYIRECDSQTRTDVEKENAHFYFSEAIISALEYIKFSEKCKKYFEASDENIMTLNSFDYSTNNSNSNDFSAETIALAIMDSWKNHKIPTAIELFWMIPYQEEIIEELPSSEDSKSIEQIGNYSSSVDNSQRILRRGNSHWAPPREQLIFHIHQSISRESQLKKQNHLCAGCGRDVEKGYAHRFRYCEYTGKFFCRSCHSDKKFYLPSYIITKWEFSNKHSISNFAYDYLNRIYTEPFFNIYDLNTKLYEKSNTLRMMNQLRWALYFLRNYITTCRFAEEQGHQQTLQSIPPYVYEHPHTYSLQDLVKTKLGELHKEYEPIVVNLREHVLSCSLCYAKGYICEICQDDKSILFPFNVQTTSICPVCQSCFHIFCHEKKKFICPKCERTKHRSTITSVKSK